MDAQKMIEVLTEESEKLKNELLSMEKEFNVKKEQYIKIQGALEALNELDSKDD